MNINELILKKTTLLLTLLSLFSINIFAQPANNLCTGATNLTVGATCSNTLVTFDGTATDSGILAPVCANYTGGDLWYSLTMPASGAVSIKASNDDGSITNVGMSIYSGSDCGSLKELLCAFNNGVGAYPEANISQPAGSTIYIRVWEEGNDAIGTFNLCVTEITTAVPVNNECAGAIDLTVGALDTCSNTLITVDGTATDSGIGNPFCADYVGGDLWYKLTVPASGSIRIETDTNDNSITDGGMAVYTGADCNNLELYECKDGGNTDSLEDFERLDLYGRTPGEVIYVRVWVFNGAETGTFNICTYEITPLTPVTNDDCVDAIELTVGSTCIPILASNYLATSSEVADPTIPAPGCANYNGNDVWFKVTVPASGRLEIETYENDGTLNDGGMAVYSGSCDPSGLILEACDDDNGVITPSKKFERIELSGRTPGEELFIRIWAFENSRIGTFNICAVALNALGNDKNEVAELEVFPNPVSTDLVVFLKSINSLDGDVKLYDIQGKLVFKKLFFKNDSQIKIDVSQFSKGMYFLKFGNSKGVISKKIIIE